MRAKDLLGILQPVTDLIQGPAKSRSPSQDQDMSGILPDHRFVFSRHFYRKLSGAVRFYENRLSLGSCLNIYLLRKPPDLLGRLTAGTGDHHTRSLQGLSDVFCRLVDPTGSSQDLWLLHMNGGGDQHAFSPGCPVICQFQDTGSLPSGSHKGDHWFFWSSQLFYDLIQFHLSSTPFS